MFNDFDTAFYYEDGKLFNKINRCRARIDVNIGDGYRNVKFNRKNYYTRRVIWLLHYGAWPCNEIDHIDQDKLNNSIDNLRDVTPTTNQKNRPKQCNNKSGICWHKATNKWEAQIMVNGKQLFLGYFSDLADAVLVRQEADIKYNFHSNNGNIKI